jgi:hypothetical protein
LTAIASIEIGFQNAKTKVVAFAANNLVAGKVVNGFGHCAKIFVGNYAIGLSRDSFLLSERVSAGQKIQVKNGGYYSDQGELILQSNFMPSTFRLAGIDRFSLEGVVPEYVGLESAFRSALFMESRWSKTVPTAAAFIATFTIAQASQWFALDGHYNFTLHSFYNSKVMSALQQLAATAYLAMIFIPKLSVKDISPMVQKVLTGIFIGAVACNTFDVATLGVGVNPFSASIFKYNLADVTMFTSGPALFFTLGQLELNKGHSTIGKAYFIFGMLHFASFWGLLLGCSMK